MDDFFMMRSSGWSCSQYWKHVCLSFISEYQKKGSGSGEVPGAEHRVPCSSGSANLGEKQVCDVPIDDFHPCTPANQYNYEEAGPCVFLKLNKVRDKIVELLVQLTENFKAEKTTQKFKIHFFNLIRW